MPARPPGFMLLTADKCGELRSPHASFICFASGGEDRNSAGSSEVRVSVPASTCLRRLGS